MSSPRQEFANDVADDRRAAQAAADEHAEADSPASLRTSVDADVVDQRRRAIGRRRPLTAILNLRGR